MRDLRVSLSSELDTGYFEVCTGLVTVSDVDVPVVSANDPSNDTHSETRSVRSCRVTSCSIVAGGLLVGMVRRATVRMACRCGMTGQSGW